MTITLDEARSRAAAAAETAEDLRAQLAAGADVATQVLVDAEQDEDHAHRVLEAAEQREQHRAAEQAAEQRSRDVDAIRAERAALTGEPAELTRLRQTAVDAVVEYVKAWRARLDYLDDLEQREVDLGVREQRTVARSQRPSPLVPLGRAVVAAIRPRHIADWQWTTVREDDRTGVWGS